jgi:O-antigen/teichoic acid export membrane protein
VSVAKGLLVGNLAFAIQTIVRLFSTAIVARLITPIEMGIWTLGFALIGLFQIMRDFGTATFIQTNKELTNEQIKVCNGLQLIVGLLFFFIFTISAEPIAAFYKEPRVSQVVYVLAFGFLIMPLSSTSFNLLIRDGRFALKSGIDFVAQMMMYAGTVALAFLGGSHLSAPISVVIAQVLVVLLCFYYRNQQYPLGYSFKNVKGVAKLSGTALSVSLIQHAADKSPDFVLPKTQGFAEASIYEKGINCLELVKLAVVELVGSVLVASLRLRSEKDSSIFPSLASDTLSCLAVLAVLGSSLLAVNAYDFLNTLFGAQWVGAQNTLKVLAFATPFVCMTAFLTKVMYLQSMHSIVLRLAFVTRLIVIGLVLILANGPILTLAFGVVIAEILFFIAYAYVNREKLAWGRFIAPTIIDSAICIFVVFGIHYGVKNWFNLNSIAALAINSALVAVSVAIVFFLFRKSTVNKLRNCLNL